MRKLRAFCWILFICTLSIVAAEKKAKKGKSGFSLDKRATLIIGIPVDASAEKKEKNEWFSGLAELYLHFRIGASNSLDIIPSEKIHQKVIKTGTALTQDNKVYASFVKDFGASHILQHNYELSRDGKSIHYYAEITSTRGSQHFGSFERDFDLQDFSSAMDSCVFWFFKTSGIGFNEKMLSRFYNLKTISSDPKEMKIIGKIITRRYVSTTQEINTSTEALIAAVERDPKNLIAQYIAARLYESSGQYNRANEQLKNLLIIIPNYASLYGDVCRNYRSCEQYSEALSYAAHAERKGIITRALMLEGARSLESMGKYSKAKKVFTIILKADSTEPNGLIFFARLNNQQQNAEKAITYSDKILSVNPNNGEALLEKGKALFHLKRYKNAEEVLTKSAGLVTNAAVPTELIGDIHAQSNDYEKAALFYEAAFKNKSDDYALLRKSVDTWDNAKKPDKALKILQKAENIFPDSLIIQKKLGLFYYQTGDTANAVFHLEQFLEKGKRKDAQVLLTLGDIYTQKGTYDKAFYMYNHAMPLLPDKTKGTLSLALLYLRKGDIGAAISYLREIVKSQPEYPDAYRYLGDAWFNERNYSTSLKNYKKARFFKKDDPYIQKRIANIYFNLAEYNAATREFLQLLTIIPNDPEPHFHLAIAYLHLNKVNSAEENLEKTFKLGKPDSEILFRLGNGYAHVLDGKKAIEYYMQCITLNPKHEKAFLQLSEAYRKEGNKREAAEIYRKLYKLDHTKYNRYLAKAGFLYEQVNDTAKAYTLFTTFVNNNYSNPQCNIHLARIEYSRKKYQAVIKLLEKIPEAEISEKSDMLVLADAYCTVGKPQKAIPWLLNIVSRNNKHKEALVMLAVSYEKTGDYNNALKNYKKVLDLASEEEKTLYSFQIALLYEKSSNTEDAIEAYRNNINNFPQFVKNYNRLANLYSKSEDWGAVREVLEKGVRLSNAKPFYWKKLAEVCLKQNDKAGAVKHYKKYLEINPKDDEAWLQLGDLYYNRGVFSKALNFYKKANELKPDNFTVLYKSALAFHNTGDNTMAIKLFSRAFEIDSTNTDVLNYLALCYRSINDVNNLSKTLIKLSILEPDNYAVKVELGCSLLGQGKTQEAIDHLETACKMNPKDAETHIILSGIYASTGNNNARYSHLKKALIENANSADVQCLMGKFYMEQKEYTTALKHIEKALALNPDHTETLHAYSKYLFTQGQTEKALTYIKQAVKNDAYNPIYLVLYAKINHAIGKNNIALKTIENALTLDSTNAEILSCAGFIYKEADRVEEAKKILLKAISLSDKCSECFTYLGEIYFEETQCAKAAGFFRRALAILGYNEDVMMKLGRALVLSYQNEVAKEIFEKVFIKNPKHHEAFYRLAHIYLLWKDTEKVNALIAQRKSDQKTVWDHLVQGELLELKGNVEAALISFSVALRLQLEMPEAHAGKGRIDLIQGNYNNAIVNFSKALVKDPYNPYLLLDLGKAYEGIGQFSSAFDIYSDVADKYSLIPETYTLIAGIRSREKKHKGAVEIVQKGLKHNPENADLYSVLGREFNILGEHTRAIEAYKNALKYGNDKNIEDYLKIATIYYNNLRNEKEAKKFLKKYLKKGGKKEHLEKYNLARLGI